MHKRPPETTHLPGIDLTTRGCADAEEIGIAAHGSASAHLGHELGELTRTWHAGPRLHEPTITITRDSTGTTRAGIGWR